MNISSAGRERIISNLESEYDLETKHKKSTSDLNKRTEAIFTKMTEKINETEDEITRRMENYYDRSGDYSGGLIKERFRYIDDCQEKVRILKEKVDLLKSAIPDPEKSFFHKGSRIRLMSLGIGVKDSLGSMETKLRIHKKTVGKEVASLVKSFFGRTASRAEPRHDDEFRAFTGGDLAMVLDEEDAYLKKFLNQRGPNEIKLNTKEREAFESIQREVRNSQQLAELIKNKPSEECAIAIKKQIEQLKNGEAVWIPGGYQTIQGTGHTFMCLVEKQAENQYSFTVINTGEGLGLERPEEFHPLISHKRGEEERYHYKKINLSKEKISDQTFLTNLVAFRQPEERNDIEGVYGCINDHFGNSHNARKHDRGSTIPSNVGNCVWGSISATTEQRLRAMLKGKTKEVVEEARQAHRKFTSYVEESERRRLESFRNYFNSIEQDSKNKYKFFSLERHTFIRKETHQTVDVKMIDRILTLNHSVIMEVRSQAPPSRQLNRRRVHRLRPATAASASRRTVRATRSSSSKETDTSPPPQKTDSRSRSWWNSKPFSRAWSWLKGLVGIS